MTIKSSLDEIFPDHLKHYQKEMNDDSELKVIYYEAPVQIIRDRLDVLGYDLQSAKEAFKTCIKLEHDTVLRTVEKKEHQYLWTHYMKISEILSDFTPELWIDRVKELHSLKHDDLEQIRVVQQAAQLATLLSWLRR